MKKINTLDFTIDEKKSIASAMEMIDKNLSGVVFVTKNEKLVGSVTDGDIRRYILKKGDIDNDLSILTNKSVKFVYEDDDIDVNTFLIERKISAVPIINKSKEIVAIQVKNKTRVHKNTKLNIPLVINAGGKGTRLYPYTKVLPKPLIPVHDKTITEIILDKFMEFGVNDFRMIVNYKKELIKAFFETTDYKIKFTDEEKFLGTGGGLALLKGKYKGTFFMSNCDVLIDNEYDEFIDYHKKHKNIITLIGAKRNVKFPYGDIKLNKEGQIASILEKPEVPFLTNTGLYIIEPEFLDYIKNDEFMHITNVIEKCIKSKENVGVYPVSDLSWHDMGDLELLEKMRQNYQK